jgi:hypothetical protein
VRTTGAWLFFFFFDNSGVGTQGLMLGRLCSTSCATPLALFSIGYFVLFIYLLPYLYFLCQNGNVHHNNTRSERGMCRAKA